MTGFESHRKYGYLQRMLYGLNNDTFSDLLIATIQPAEVRGHLGSQRSELTKNSKEGTDLNMVNKKMKTSPSGSGSDVSMNI